MCNNRLEETKRHPDYQQALDAAMADMERLWTERVELNSDKYELPPMWQFEKELSEQAAAQIEKTLGIDDADSALKELLANEVYVGWLASSAK